MLEQLSSSGPNLDKKISRPQYENSYQIHASNSYSTLGLEILISLINLSFNLNTLINISEILGCFELTYNINSINNIFYIDKHVVEAICIIKFECIKIST